MTRVAYLTSRYPAPSHAFVQREILALRELGVEVDTFALRRASDAEVLSEVDSNERETTYALQPIRWGAVVRAHARALVTRPAAWASTLATAVRGGRGLRARLWQVFYFGEAVLLWDELRRRGLRHVHVHFANAAADVAMLATRFGGDAWSWSLTLHGPAEFLDVEGVRLVAKLRSAAFVACASDWSRSQAMALVPSADWSRLLLVRGGIDPDVWTATERSTGATLRVLNVGRLAPVKGQALLIDAVADLRDEGLAIACTIVGEGPERPVLEQRIAERSAPVELAGAVAQDQIVDRYRDADVFALPSFREGLPFVLMEAMATELPVVTTRIMGIPELVTDGDSGLLVTAGRIDQLRAALRRLADDSEERTRLGRAGRAVVVRDYDLRRSAERMRELLDALPPAPQ